MLEDYIKKQEMIDSLQEIIRIPSVHSESNKKEEPFGKNAEKALEYILNLGRKLGFKTKNVDGYCGYIEFGEGQKMLGIIGHLDVVPEGEGWTDPPFSATIKDNKIYGRGAIDDKGPVIASLYAMKAVYDYCMEKKIILDKRVRLILGLNEERDWKCIEYYKKHEEWPTIGFSPDADFPCIYAEKGIISTYLKMDYTKYQKERIVIEDVSCNNNPLNVVPKYASAKIKVNGFDINEVNEKIREISHEFDVESKIINNTIEIISHGIQSHAAHPDMGINAISRLMIIIQKVFKIYNISVPIFELFEKYIGIEYNGESMKINNPDESGNLTLNVGNIELKENQFKIGFNLRVPIYTKFKFIEEHFEEICSEYEGVKCEFTGIKDPLYISKDSYLIQTLCDIYNKHTKSNEKPIAIGGATYARAFENCVSFGANLPGQKDMCHQVDEFISIDNLYIATEIYADAILKI